jgi:cation/acetate symporter
MANISLIMFLLFIAITLGITYWASKRSSGASAYFAASRQIKGWQNGIAVAGDYMSAASFLGIAGIIAFQGYDGFMFSVGWLVAYLTVLLVIAEPLRNAGKYTMADVLAYRLNPRPVHQREPRAHRYSEPPTARTGRRQRPWRRSVPPPACIRCVQP